MFNLLVSFSGWTPPRGTISKSRFLTQTTSDVKQAVCPNGVPDYAILTNLKTLFMQELDTPGEPFGRLGTIKNISDMGGEYSFEFYYDPTIPPIPLDQIEEMSLEFGTEGFGLNNTHWSVKRNDIFEMLYRRNILKTREVEAEEEGQKLEIGQTIKGGNTYKVKKQIGQGGLGRVYLLENELTGNKYAGKLLSFHRFKENQDGQLLRFKKEFENQNKVQHPNVIPVIEYINIGEKNIIVMEKAEGESLYEYFNMMEYFGAELSFQNKMDLMKCICSGVAALHDSGIVHRDLTPKNILFISPSQPAITDFGIARHIDDPTLTKTTHRLGSVIYISPQQRKSPHEATFQDDIYSLGMIFFQILTGKNPQDARKPISEYTDCLKELQEIIDNFRDENRESRPVDASEALKILQSIPTNNSAGNGLKQLADQNKKRAETEIQIFNDVRNYFGEIMDEDRYGSQIRLKAGPWFSLYIVPLHSKEDLSTTETIRLVKKLEIIPNSVFAGDGWFGRTKHSAFFCSGLPMDSNPMIDKHLEVKTTVHLFESKMIAGYSVLPFVADKINYIKSEMLERTATEILISFTDALQKGLDYSGPIFSQIVLGGIDGLMLQLPTGIQGKYLIDRVDHSFEMDSPTPKALVEELKMFFYKYKDKAGIMQ